MYYYKKIVPYFLMSTRYNYTIPEQIPKLVQITISRGIGDGSKNPKELDCALEELSLITGQLPKKNKAKKAIAGFKIREGIPVGVSVTLRKNKMYSFLTRLIHVALPRVRDFRGLTLAGFDGKGNYNLSLTLSSSLSQGNPFDYSEIGAKNRRTVSVPASIIIPVNYNNLDVTKLANAESIKLENPVVLGEVCASTIKALANSSTELLAVPIPCVGNFVFD
jgi:large subunit ribosomal protein L5